MVRKELSTSHFPKDSVCAQTYFDFGSSTALAGKPVPLTFLRDHARHSANPVEKMEFEDGYREGLGKMLDNLNVGLKAIGVREVGMQNPVETTLFHIFSEDAGIIGLNSGLAREKPVVPSSPVRSSVNTAPKHYEDGFRIGWAISSTKEYGRVPLAKAIPAAETAFDAYVKARKGDFSSVPVEANIPGDLFPVIFEGTSHWLKDKGFNIVSADVVLHLKPLVRVGFSSVVSGQKLRGKIANHPDVLKGAGFAARLLEARRVTRRNEIMKGSSQK